MARRALFMAAAVVALVVIVAVWAGTPTRVANIPVPVSMVAGSWAGMSCTVEITAVRDSTINVSELTYQIRGHNKTVYYDGTPGTGATVNGLTVTVSFNDRGREGLLDVNDSIVVSVSNTDALSQVHGTRLSLFESLGGQAKNHIGSVTLQ